MDRRTNCPSCSTADISIFYEVSAVPAHSVVLLRTKDLALNFPTGNIKLGHCQKCGFITNLAFDPELHDYSSDYESTQTFSPTYSAFSRSLAQDLIARYDLHGKEIVEIGCGHGEFLSLLCELGNNAGIGFDPAYIPGRVEIPENCQITFVQDYFSEAFGKLRADFISCRMTLEHIQDTEEFVRMVRRSIGDQADTIVYFQVPDVSRILQEAAFWDIFYEHCSYFSLGSLARLFRRCEFEIINLRKEFDDQYLIIEARPGNSNSRASLPQEEDLEKISSSVQHFALGVRKSIAVWKERIEQYHQDNTRVIIWGASSKGVSFLTTLGIRNEIEYAVDINPYKDKTFIPGSGQMVHMPEFLQDYEPEIVIVMNPIYNAEIRKTLQQLGQAPTLVNP